jgi:hypothetical protein
MVLQATFGTENNGIHAHLSLYCTLLGILSVYLEYVVGKLNHSLYFPFTFSTGEKQQ